MVPWFWSGWCQCAVRGCGIVWGRLFLGSFLCVALSLGLGQNGRWSHRILKINNIYHTMHESQVPTWHCIYCTWLNPQALGNKKLNYGHHQDSLKSTHSSIVVLFSRYKGRGTTSGMGNHCAPHPLNISMFMNTERFHCTCASRQANLMWWVICNL